jgi:hypothetical protein
VTHLRQLEVKAADRFLLRVSDVENVILGAPFLRIDRNGAVLRHDCLLLEVPGEQKALTKLRREEKESKSECLVAKAKASND